ncbi:ribonuclease III [Patescibacteria group bacterium]|nr:ribonuclease III [Patescibacteria group bacterium]
MTFPTFKNPDLLTTALTHRSALNEHISTSTESNERLEFLGDAVLELVATDFLYERFPTEQEGMLTVYRSALVKTTTLAEVAQKLQLGEKLYMSKGEESSKGRQNTGLLANAFEALLGALYLDQGIEAVRELLNELLFPMMDNILKKRLYKHSKSQLQEVLQAKGITAPDYVVVGESGPDHDRQFTVKAVINGQDAATGIGKSKQLAQEAAAQAVLEDEALLESLLRKK